MLNLRFALSSALNFDDREVTTFLVISVLSGFILSFRKWGTDSFDAGVGLSNLALFSFIFFVLFFIFIYTQKVFAFLVGTQAKLVVWRYGPPLGVLVTMLSYGFVPFVFLGGVELKEIPRLRLGKFRHQFTITNLAVVGVSGPLVLILLSLLVFFPLFLFSGSYFWFEFVKISSLILVMSALPFPSLNGINLLLKSRSLWLAFFVYAVCIYLLFSYLLNPFVYVFALVITGVVVWFVNWALKDSSVK